MKIRKGFVTNSSSSSFIIAIKNNLEEESMKVFLDNMFKDSCSDKEKYEKDILWNYGYNSVEELKEDSYIYKEYQKSIKAIEEGYSIVCESVEYDAVEQFDTMITALEKAGVAKILEKEY